MQGPMPHQLTPGQYGESWAGGWGSEETLTLYISILVNFPVMILMIDNLINVFVALREGS